MLDRPRLSRRRPPPVPGIVHLGPGAFFRAFNAVYTQDALDRAGGDWGIVAVSLKSPAARDQLAPQGCAFTSETLLNDGARYRIIEAVTDALVAPESPAAVLAIMADPRIRIVSLTVTEKGYCHEPSTGRLRLDHPDIVHDLASPKLPRSAPGFIVEALAQRREAGLRPFTVLSCDNLPSNGALVRGVVTALAAARDPALARWIEAEVPFPATMVDRITPATTEADIAEVRDAQGYTDFALVKHEPFRQWVVEDEFVDGARPAWEAGGAQFVADVSAHETMKLRCLNGTHSALAYLGYLAGFETIAETVADADFARFCERLWAEEIVPTVPPPEGEDLASYCKALMERFRSPAIHHRTWQIAMDGSQKLPQRLLGTATDALEAGRSTPGIALAVAAWMRYVGAVDERGAPIDVQDPMSERLKAVSDAAATPKGKVAALLSQREIFADRLADRAAFREQVTAAYLSLLEHGARAAVATHLARGPEGMR